MNTIRRYGNQMDAELARTVLLDAGINAILLDAGVASLGPQFAPWGIRLQVPEEDAGRALEILDRVAGPEEAVEAVEEYAAEPGGPMEQEVGSPNKEDEAAKAEVVCPGCGTGWALTAEEKARPEFTCTECGTSIPTDAGAIGTAEPSFWTRFLPRSESRWVFVLVTVAFARTLQALVGDILYPFMGEDRYLNHFIGWGRTAEHLANSTILTPIWETLVLVLVIELARAIRLPAFLQIAISTAVLCAIDGWYVWPHGLAVSPFFVISGMAYLYLRPASRVYAAATLMLIHCVSNSIPGIYTICLQAARSEVSSEQAGDQSAWPRAEGLYREALKKLKGQYYSSAEEELQQAIAIYPYDSRYYIELGIVLDDEGRLGEAAAKFRAATDLNNQDYSAWEWLGSVRYEEKDYLGALEAFHRAQRVAPPYKQPLIERWIETVAPYVSGSASSQGPLETGS